MPELLVQDGPGVPVDGERRRDVAAAVEGEHELPPGPLAQRVGGEVAAQLGQQFPVLADGQPRLGQLLEDLEPLLVEACPPVVQRGATGQAVTGQPRASARARR